MRTVFYTDKQCEQRKLHHSKLSQNRQTGLVALVRPTERWHKLNRTKIPYSVLKLVKACLCVEVMEWYKVIYITVMMIIITIIIIKV